MRSRMFLKVGIHFNSGDEERERFDGPRANAGIRKKGLGARVWLLIDPNGDAQMVEAGKHAIMRRTGLPGRDLRILDPMLSYPSTILGRERAIVVSLEHIKAIITAHEVLLVNPKDPAVAPFVEDLQRRLPHFYNGLGQQVSGVAEGGLSDLDGESGSKIGFSALSTPFLPTRSESPLLQHSSLDSQKFSDQKSLEKNTMGPKVLPFEFRALEVCLEAACSCLDAEATALEQEAHPALDELTSKISTLNLERVRQIKSRLVAISGRVQKVRDELEQLLDDDGDMAEMYLTDKLLSQQSDGPPSPSSADGSDESANHRESDQVDSDEDGGRPLHEAERGPVHTLERILDEAGIHGGSARSRHGLKRLRSSISGSSSHNGDSKHLDVEELEMLLEAYFVQIDGTLNKLSALREYVDDTEDYINIMLDDKQNHLLQMGVILTTATLVLSGFIVVTGIFGMNIHIELFDDGTLAQFLWVVSGSAMACVFLYVLVIGWCKWKRLLE
eukprot:c23481_g1_i1 orf=444-1946(-)